MAYTREALEKEMREVVADFVDCEPAELDLDKKLRDEYGITSIEAAELILELEDRYHLNIPVEQAKVILSTNDAINYVLQNAK
jgi:acyl carrier protein